MLAACSLLCQPHFPMWLFKNLRVFTYGSVEIISNGPIPKT
jgi:hypothetical protein